MIQSEKQLYLKTELGRNAGQMKQLRGHDNDVAQKYRITVELRQLVLNWFSADKKPTDVLGRSLVIVAGVRCRLSNISDAGTWLQTENFKVGETMVNHIKGRSARGAMASWVQLRRERPELFKRIDVMQQPAAVMDSVLFQWVLEDQAMQFPVSLWMRDLSGGGGFALQSEIAMKLAGQVPSWVLGKMTSVLQITDTDFARPLKLHANQAKQELRQILKATAAQTGANESLKCGHAEILFIIDSALRLLEESCAGKCKVIEAGVRNGILAYRPNWSTGKLDPVEGQPWLKELIGDKVHLCKSHRLTPEWGADRMKWLDSEGVPVKPMEDKKGLEEYAEDATVAAHEEVKIAADEEDGAELDVQGPSSTVGGAEYQETQIALGVFADWADDMKEDVVAAIQAQVSVRSRVREMQVDMLVTPQGAPAARGAKVKQKRKKKVANAAARKKILEAMVEKSRKEMKRDGKSRMELLKAVQPQVAQKCRRRLKD